MKFTIHRDYFSGCLAQVISGASGDADEVDEARRHVLVQAGDDFVTLMTWGLRCKVAAYVTEKGGVRLPARRLAAFLSEFTNVDVSFEATFPATVEIAAGGARYRIMGHPEAVFPSAVVEYVPGSKVTGVRLGPVRVAPLAKRVTDKQMLAALALIAESKFADNKGSGILQDGDYCAAMDPARITVIRAKLGKSAAKLGEAGAKLISYRKHVPFYIELKKKGIEIDFPMAGTIHTFEVLSQLNQISVIAAKRSRVNFHVVDGRIVLSAKGDWTLNQDYFFGPGLDEKKSPAFSLNRDFAFDLIKQARLLGLAQFPVYYMPGDPAVLCPLGNDCLSMIWTMRQQK